MPEIRRIYGCIKTVQTVLHGEAMRSNAARWRA
jgi:hypothetical protein